MDQELSSGSSFGKRKAMLLCPEIMFIHNTMETLPMDLLYKLYIGQEERVADVH